MLNAEAVRYGLEPIPDFTPVIDPLIIDGRIDKYRKGRRTLTATAEVYGVSLEGAHDAEADAVATGGVCWAVLDRLPNQDWTPATLHEHQRVWAEERAAGFQEYLRRTKDPTAVIDGGWPVRSEK
jgi:DNA polymerase-3 subunit epsilon